MVRLYSPLHLVVTPCPDSMRPGDGTRARLAITFGRNRSTGRRTEWGLNYNHKQRKCRLPGRLPCRRKLETADPIRTCSYPLEDRDRFLPSSGRGDARLPENDAVTRFVCR